MDWECVNTQDDLDRLNSQICWEDSRTIEYYAKYADETYFPTDVSRSGYPNKNIHLLCEIDSPRAAYLEVVLIDCDWYYYQVLDRLHLSGRVDSLKRVDVRDGKGSTILRCSRLIFRFLQPHDLPQGPYFRNAASIASQA